MIGTDRKFGFFRSFLWPIYGRELKKVLPMLATLFLICFNYTVLRNLKDSLVVTTSGAEVIPFIKVWVMLPAAILLTWIYAKLCNRFSQEKVFYIVISGFLTSYLLFAFLLYPYQHTLHPEASAETLRQLLPAGCKGLINMYRNWTFTLFYVMSELWSSMVLTVLFWGFANQVTSVKESQRYYSVFSVWMNFATIAAGMCAIYCSTITLPFLKISDAWGQTITSLILLVTASGLASMVLFRWMNKNVFDKAFSCKKHTKEKKKLSLRQSVSYVSNSPYLLSIAILVVSYNLVINLVEVVWKDQLRLLYPGSGEYNIYMNWLTSATALISTLTALFMPKIISRLGWTPTALITPLITLFTSLAFFSFILFQDFLGPSVIALTGSTPLALAVLFGSSQNCFCKAAKYSVFDATKEMAYIPLSEECKRKGKAAIDGIGSRLGKSGGSLIHQSLIMTFGSIAISAPYVAAILLLVIVLWIISVNTLGYKFNSLVAEQEGATEEEPLLNVV